MTSINPQSKPVRRGGKRGNGEGTIYQRQSDGRWCASVSLENGLRKVIYGKTRQEVARKLTSTLRDVQVGLPLPSERLTLERFCRTGWPPPSSLRAAPARTCGTRQPVACTSSLESVASR